MLSKIIYPCIFIIALLIMIVLGISICNFTYNQGIAYATNMFGNADLQNTITQYISADRFSILKKIIWIVCIICAIAIGAIIQHRNKIQATCQSIFNTIFVDAKRLFTTSHFSNIEKRFFWISISALIAHSMYYIRTWHLQHDECWTYNYFIDNHFLASFITPNNNHNLYTMLCWFANLLLDGKWAMRLIALTAGLLSIFVFAQICKRYNSALFFIIAIVLFCTSLPMLNYCISGRSYSFTILFTTIGILCMQAIHQFPTRHKYYFYLAISQALGIFSNVGYVYVIIGFVVVSIIFITKSTLRLWVKCWAICGIVSFALLSIPLLLLHGIQPLLDVTNTSFDFTQIGKYCMLCANTISYYFIGSRQMGITYLGTILFILLILFLIIKKQRQTISKTPHTVYLALIQITLPFVFFAWQQQVIFERMFTYLVPFIAILLSFCLVSFFKKISDSFSAFTYAILLLIPLSFYGFRQHVLFRWSAAIDKATANTASYLLAQTIDTCYNFYVYSTPSITYQYNLKNQSIYFIKSNKGSISYQAFDTTKHYPCILSATEDNMQFIGYKKTTIDGIIDIWE